MVKEKLTKSSEAMKDMENGKYKIHDLVTEKEVCSLTDHYFKCSLTGGEKA